VLQRPQCKSSAAQYVALPRPISDLTCDGESLLMALQGLLRLTQDIVCKAEVAQMRPLPSSVSDLTCDGESLLDGTPGPSVGSPRHSAQGRGCPDAFPPLFCLRISRADGESLLIALQGLPSLTQGSVCIY